MAVLSWAPPPAAEPPDPAPPIIVEVDLAPPPDPAPVPSARPHPAPGPAAAGSARPDRTEPPVPATRSERVEPTRHRAAPVARSTPTQPAAPMTASEPVALSNVDAPTASAEDGAARSGAVASDRTGHGDGGSGNGPGDGQGNGGRGEADAIAAYLSDVRARLQRSLIYPPKARRIGLHGEIKVRMRILADGSIDPDSIRVVGEGGNPVLIAGALETVERVALTPPPRPRIEIVAPIQFRLD